MKRALKTIKYVGSFFLLSFVVFASGFLGRFSGQKEKTSTNRITPLSLFSIPQAHADAPGGDGGGDVSGDGGGDSGGGGGGGDAGSSDSSGDGSGDC